MSAEKKALRRARRERARRRAMDRSETALALPCPVCTAAAGVWCFLIGRDLGPGMHERRWLLGDRIEARP